jgi:hypothetical protein
LGAGSHIPQKGQHTAEQPLLKGDHATAVGGPPSHTGTIIAYSTVHYSEWIGTATDRISFRRHHCLPAHQQRKRGEREVELPPQQPERAYTDY